ncbi:protein ITPRID1 isoform X2 [Dendropsophus ebraccatus]|uniref:protein ITPRID1 isoform X2 n=1 Tax=Dendropsophus ebraccatus TaxID=150705 RepID=UPI0038316769
MEDPELGCPNGTESTPGLESKKHAGSMCRMGIINLSVKDYMSSLHNYIETFSTAKSDGSTKSARSLPTSISEMLKLCEADPVDLLIDLGFGIDEPDICNKIPSRFIMTPSEARGINTQVFLEAQRKRLEIENPNLCGRFRQLEVLEQVTSAFSSLLNNIHTIKSNDSQNSSSERKSALTPEKRRRIRQLLWKFSKQVKIVDENISPTIIKAETEIPKEDQEPPGPLKDSSSLNVFRKRKHSIDDSHLVTLSAEGYENTPSDGQQAEASSLSVPKQCSHSDMAVKIRTLKGSKVLSKTLKKTVQQRLQSPDPESFEMEEVLSFEEDCPRTVNQDSISEMTRTNSCQSDSSGFLEEPSEPLPLQNLHLSSDSNDSQTTLRGKADLPVFHDKSEEYDDVSHITEPLEPCSNTAISGFKTFKSLSMNTENSDDVFQSFDSQTFNINEDNIPETQSQEPAVEDTGNEAQADSVGYLLQCEMDVSVHEDEVQSPKVPSEVAFPIYVTHYLSDIRQSTPDSPGEINHSLMPDFSEDCVSELHRIDSDRDSFADDECSVELSNLKWTPSPTSDLHSFSFQAHTPEGSVDNSDGELNTDFLEDQKSKFQTEINTNIYKSVTIQMSSNSLQDTHDGLNRPNTITTNTNRSEVHALLQRYTEQKEAYSQTDMGWWNECCTNNHCSHQRRCYLRGSLSFDTAFWSPHRSPFSPQSAHCCHCCHCHHCCTPRSLTKCTHNVPLRPSAHSNLERELSETLKLLRESLFSISLNADQDVENMKKACQKYREKLIEIEQRLTEQQAGCYHIISGEERENMRRMHLLRQNVLKEALELEFNLDARARQVKESISLQLDEILEEQSRLYSDLEFYNWEQDRNSLEHYERLQRTHSLPSTSSCTVHKEDQGISINQDETRALSQKIDLSTILQNIKKTFRNFNNS